MYALMIARLTLLMNIKKCINLSNHSSPKWSNFDLDLISRLVFKHQKDIQLTYRLPLDQEKRSSLCYEDPPS